MTAPKEVWLPANVAPQNVACPAAVCWAPRGELCTGVPGGGFHTMRVERANCVHWLAESGALELAEKLAKGEAPKSTGFTSKGDLAGDPEQKWDWPRRAAAGVAASRETITSPREMTKKREGDIAAYACISVKGDAADLILECLSGLAFLREQNMCDACAGTGTPTSGPGCMCGGSGRIDRPKLRGLLLSHRSGIRRGDAGDRAGGL